MLDNGYRELPISSEHAVAINDLPPIHKDPFDRLLVAESMVEGIILPTSDPLVAQYPRGAIVLQDNTLEYSRCRHSLPPA